MKLFSKLQPKMLNSLYNTSVAGSIVFPPATGSLVAWHQGVGSNTTLADSYAIPDVFPLEMSGAKCATFDGASFINIGAIGTSTSDIDISLSFRVDSFATQSQLLNRYWESLGLRIETSGIVRFVVKTNGDPITYSADISGLTTGAEYTLHAVASLTSGTASLTVGSTTVVKPITGTAWINSTEPYTIGAGGAAGSASRFSGSIWDVTVDGVHFPLTEGSGDTVHASNGAETGTITSADLPTFWGSTQDSYFFEAVNGYWLANPDDGVRYPSDPGGGTHYPGNIWNSSSNSYKFKEKQAATYEGSVNSYVILDSISQEVASDTIYHHEFKFTLNTLPSTSLVNNDILRVRKDVAPWNICELRVRASDNRVAFSHTQSNETIITSLSTVALQVGKAYHVKIYTTGTDIYLDVDGVITSASYDGTMLEESSTRDPRLGDLQYYHNGTIQYAKVWGKEIDFGASKGSSELLWKDGTHAGTITTPDINAFWADTQVPYEVLKADAAWEFFTDQTTLESKVFTQNSLDFSTAGLNQYFFGACYGVGLGVYSAVLSGQELTDTQAFFSCT